MGCERRVKVTVPLGVPQPEATTLPPAVTEFWLTWSRGADGGYCDVPTSAATQLAVGVWASATPAKPMVASGSSSPVRAAMMRFLPDMIVLPLLGKGCLRRRRANYASQVGQCNPTRLGTILHLS